MFTDTDSLDEENINKHIENKTQAKMKSKQEEEEKLSVS